MDQEWTKRIKVKKLKGRPPKILKFSMTPAQFRIFQKFGVMKVGGYLLTIDKA